MCVFFTGFTVDPITTYIHLQSHPPSTAHQKRRFPQYDLRRKVNHPVATTNDPPAASDWHLFDAPWPQKNFIAPKKTTTCGMICRSKLGESLDVFSYFNQLCGKSVVWVYLMKGDIWQIINIYKYIILKFSANWGFSPWMKNLGAFLKKGLKRLEIRLFIAVEFSRCINAKTGITGR